MLQRSVYSRSFLASVMQMDAKIDNLDKKVDAKIDNLDQKIDAKIDNLDRKIDAKVDKIISLIISFHGKPDSGKGEAQ